MQFKLIIAALLGMLSLLFAAPALAQAPAAPDTITVTGTGSASGAPDIANLIFGVETFDPDINQAFERTNEAIEAVINAIVAAGVERADIRTVGLNIYQDRSGMVPPGVPLPEDSSRAFYSVSNQVRVTVRDIARVGDIISVAVDAGANGLYGLEFAITDRTALEAQARDAAFTDAQARAREIARLMGVAVADVSSVVEMNNGYPPFDFGQRMGGGADAAVIEPGQLSVTMQLQVVFRIRR